MWISSHNWTSPRSPSSHRSSQTSKAFAIADGRVVAMHRRCWSVVVESHLDVPLWPLSTKSNVQGCTSTLSSRFPCFRGARMGAFDFLIRIPKLEQHLHEHASELGADQW